MFDINCNMHYYPYLADMIKKFPDMRFTLDHCGLNEIGLLDIDEPQKRYEEGCAELAENKNQFVKQSDIEEWFVDPKPYMSVAVKSFGFDRCMAESNWFVNVAMGDNYWKAFEIQKEVCEELGANKEDMDKIFFTNCERHYEI